MVGASVVSVGVHDHGRCHALGASVSGPVRRRPRGRGAGGSRLLEALGQYSETQGRGGKSLEEMRSGRIIASVSFCVREIVGIIQYGRYSCLYE